MSSFDGSGSGCIKIVAQRLEWKQVEAKLPGKHRNFMQLHNDVAVGVNRLTRRFLIGTIQKNAGGYKYTAEPIE